MPTNPTPSPFDAAHAASYDARWAPLQALRDGLHLQIRLLLQDLPTDARVLCVGAGTGAELLALARHFPAWRFVAVDPSEPMLAVCRRRAEEEGVVARCRFHVGLVDELDDRPEFDAATSLMVSQFLTDPGRRTDFFRAIVCRLRPGGRLITADLCSGENGATASVLMDLHLRMMRLSAVPEEKIAAMTGSYGRDVAVSTAAEIEAMLTAAGFVAPFAFLQQMMMRAWQARKPG